MEQVLRNLKEDVYCRIQRSSIHGVGVFAIKDIPPDTCPFLLTNRRQCTETCVALHETMLTGVDPAVVGLLDDFYHKERKTYIVPYNGLNSNNISFYMNGSSKKANVRFEYLDGSDFVVFKTKRRIPRGEELLIDYNAF
jgi:hypothetical protein